jgi:hypothetical protein
MNRQPTIILGDSYPKYEAVSDICLDMLYLFFYPFFVCFGCAPVRENKHISEMV